MPNLMLVNPRSRRRKNPAKRRRAAPRRALTAVSRRSPIRRRRAYRRNPIGGGNTIMKRLTSGSVAAGGALLTDVVLAKVPQLSGLATTPVMAAAVKGGVGMGLGMLIAKVGRNKRLGEQVADGAVTLALYQAFKGMVGPQLGLSGMDDGLLGFDDGLLGYEDFNDGMGYTSAEPVQDWGDDSIGEYQDF